MERRRDESDEDFIIDFIILLSCVFLFYFSVNFEDGLSLLTVGGINISEKGCLAKKCLTAHKSG